MSRRTAMVEEFDDDTDLPLPSRPLPNTGAKGPLLKEISSDEEDEEDDLITSNEPTATTSQFQQRPPQAFPIPDQPHYQPLDGLNANQKTYVSSSSYSRILSPMKIG